MTGYDLPKRLSYQDAAFVNFERDSMPMNVGSVGIYDGPIDFHRFVEHVERRINLVPRYRQRIVRVPFDLALPRWVDDPEFDVHKHVRHVRLPEPGTREQLRELAGRFFAQRLPHDKPLWEMLLVDNVDGASAHVAKAHHCMVDGVAGVALLAALLDFEPKARREQAPRPHKAAPIPDAFELAREAIADNITNQVNANERLAKAWLDPVGAIRKAGRITRAFEVVTEYLAVPTEHAPWNMRLTGPTRVAWHRVPFADARAISKALGGTINDVILTAIAGALGRYLQGHGRRIEHLRMRAATPVNVRAEHEDAQLGNRVSFMLVSLPLADHDPIARFHKVHEETARLKGAGQAPGIDELLELVGALPSTSQALVGRMLTLPNILSNMVCTNVPGPLTPLYLMGHRMVDHYPWVPLGWRMGMSVAIMSYDQSLYFSFSIDERAPAGVEQIAADVADAFEELRAAAGVPHQRAPARPEPVPPHLVKAPEPAPRRPRHTRAQTPERAAAAASRRK